MADFPLEVQKEAKNLRIIDDALFRLVAEKKDVCQEILRTLLDDPELLVVNVITQCMLTSLNREITMDAFCRDSCGRYFNVEMQKADANDDVRRTRFHASAITASKTPTGTRFKDVPDVTILYITEYDALNNQQTVTVSRRCSLSHGEYVPVEDGETIVYANTAIKDGTKHTELLQLFLRNDSFESTAFPALSKAVRYYKDTKEGCDTVCRSIEEYSLSQVQKREIELYVNGRKSGMSEKELVARFMFSDDVVKEGNKVFEESLQTA